MPFSQSGWFACIWFGISVLPALAQKSIASPRPGQGETPLPCLATFNRNDLPIQVTAIQRVDMHYWTTNEGEVQLTFDSTVPVERHWTGNHLEAVRHTAVRGGLAMGPGGVNANFPAGSIDQPSPNLEATLHKAQAIASYLDRVIAERERNASEFDANPRHLAALQCASAFANRVIGRTRRLIRERDPTALTGPARTLPSGSRTNQ